MSRRLSPEDLLICTASAPVVDARIALLVAHPDDETLGLGSRLWRLRRLTLIHLTDGAPLDMIDALEVGFPTRDAYAAARALELDRALATAAVQPERRLCYGVVDQGTIDRLHELVERLAEELREQDAVVTHPYEGGHPDHDSAALAVQAACARLGEQAPVRLEFAGYHLGDHGLISGVFAEPDLAGVACNADSGDLTRKKAALACYVSQTRVIARFPCVAERLRLAPTYDFSRAPAPGRALYDTYGWALTSDRWRERAGAVVWV